MDVTADDNASPAGVPLVVDLDGTLVRTDLSIEALFARLGRDPLALPGLLRALGGGKANLKQAMAAASTLDADTLPYDEAVLALIRQARADGRKVYLATGSHAVEARKVADYLGLFDGVMATGDAVNLTGRDKAAALVAAFGARGFDYAGNSSVDVAVWRQARRCHAVAAPPRVLRRLRGFAPDAEAIERPRPSLRVWLRALRVHQYAKNMLLFVPVLAAHAFEPSRLAAAFIAFAAFCAAASAIYLVNDLVDLGDDRRHPTKRTRPLASGALPLGAALIATPLLLLTAVLLSFLLPPLSAAVLAGYLGLTTAYSFWLKRKMLVDVIVLALLYTVRIVAGGVAAGVVLSEWLLAFSLFAFSSLALIKRYTELLVRLDRDLPESRSRAYRKDDLPILATLAAATGSNAVTVLAMYVSSPAVMLLYARPKLLWTLCPVLLFVLARALMVAHRRQMHDDPIVWALGDRVCQFAILLSAAIAVAAAV